MNSIKSSMFIVFSLGVFINQVFAQVPSYVPSNGLVGWWPFTGNANDLSGNGNHGTVNGATLTTDRFGNANQAYLNNTSSGSITLNPSVLDNLGAFNIGIWFNASNNQGGVSDIFQIDANSPCAIYPAQTGNPNNNVYVRYDNGLAQFYFSIQINATVVQYTVPSPPSTNHWHFVSVNYTGTTVSFFINGQLLNTQALSGTFLTFNQPLFIANWCTYEDFNGKIDDIGIWNRALTQQEITNLYNANNGPQATISTANNSICAGQSATLTASVANAGTSCSTTGLPPSLNNGLVGYWPFCGNATDASGNANNGTVNGATLTTDRFGVANSAYSFDGVSNSIVIANSPNYSFLLNNSSSVSIWINTSNFNGTRSIIGQGDGDGQHQNRFWRIYFSNSMLINHLRGNGYDPFDTQNMNSSVTLNNWHLVTMVRDYNSNLKLYLNGVLVDTDIDITGLSSPFSVTRNINVGAFLNAYTGQLMQFFNGKLDDIGIWNRALSAQEVSQLYNAGQPTYAWSNGATTSSITVTPAQTTAYTCTVTMNGTTTTQSQTITVNALPNVSAGTNQTICTGTSITLSGSGASTYTWNNGVINGVSFTPNNTQTYTVTGTDGNGCTNTAQTTVTVNALPMVGAGTNQTVCAGTSVTLSGSGASTYTWNNGVSNGVSFTPNNTQTYTVTGTDGNGCTNTAQTTVTVNALPMVGAGMNQTVCAGTSVTLSGSGASTFTWNNGVTNGVSFTPNNTQTYTVTGTDGNGCANTAQVLVTVANPSSSSITETACLSYTLNGQNYTQSGTYEQNLTNVLGCDSTLTLNLTILPLPNLPNIYIALNNVLSTDAQPNTFYQWIYCTSGLPIANATDTFYTATINGVYAVEASNSCGTVSSDCITISNSGIYEYVDQLKLFPNPTKDFLIIDGLKESAINFELRDVTGRLILIGTLDASNNSLDMSPFSEGNYRLVLEGYGVFSLVKY
ncbi:MAG: LamG domain-containing protein [Flavobacteriia bacterium]|nr:LamG domain-containing protein [Flavobacteriia bacterium]